MRANSLVVESDTTWTLLEDIPDGEEGIDAHLALSTDVDEEVARQGAAELARIRDGQTQITMGIDPTGVGDVPFDDWGIGDLANADGDERRTLSLTFSRDPERNGRLVFVPQFGDILDTPEKRQQRITWKMSSGTIGGVARSAARPDPPRMQPVDANVRIPVQKVTQAEYDALDPVVDGVLYVIVG